MNVHLSNKIINIISPDKGSTIKAIYNIQDREFKENILQIKDKIVQEEEKIKPLDKKNIMISIRL